MTDLSRAKAFVNKLEKLELSEDELAHHGVLGQKWGRRKPESVAREAREQRNARNTRRKLAVGTLGASVAVSKIAGNIKRNREAQLVKDSKDHTESRELKKHKTRELSNQEIDRIVQRLQKEKKLNDLDPPPYDKGKKIVLGLVAASGTAILIYDRMHSPAGKAAIANGKKIVSALLKR